MSLDRDHRRAAKAHLIAAMDQGRSWQDAATEAGLATSRTAAYRLLQRVRLEGSSALEDGRRGHPSKLREPVVQWLIAYCQAAPETPSHRLQSLLAAQFAVSVSVGHLNHVRAVLGLRTIRPVPKKS
jgi:transposase